MTEADECGTTIKTPFGKEVDRREAHLDALPGKLYHEWFESLNRASKVFKWQHERARKTPEQVRRHTHVRQRIAGRLWHQAARLLHNYLAALATLRDTQRTIHHKLWPDPDDKDPNRTRWEVKVWDPKRKELYGDDSIAFLVKLRDYSLHYAIPIVTMGTSFRSTGGPGGPMQFKNTVAIQRPELFKWDGWTAGARQYITTHDGDDIELFRLVALYSTRVREFYAWFWEQVEDEVRLELSEYLCKHNEYCLWRHVEHTWANFGMEGRRVQFRKAAEARQERARNFPLAAGACSGSTKTASGWSASGTQIGPFAEGPSLSHRAARRCYPASASANAEAAAHAVRWATKKPGERTGTARLLKLPGLRGPLDAAATNS